MNKQFLHTIIGIFITVLVNCSVNAQSVSIWDGTSEIWTQGSGTEANPYLIQNAQQLAYIAEMVNGGVTHYENTYFKLTTNIQIDSTTAWQPIGLNETYYFSGHFDGDNHLVTLYLCTSTLQYVGIFGYSKGSISNINSSGCVKKTGSVLSLAIGGICGYANPPSSIQGFTNCKNSINITSSSSRYTGGICGYTSHLANCVNTGSIITQTNGQQFTYTGGICGVGGTMNCLNTGNITSSGNSTSIFVGGITGSGSTTTCCNTGDISSIGYYSNHSYAGGIAGRGDVTTNCYNTGAISSTYSIGGNYVSTYAGGISGRSQSGSIKNCYNVGLLTGYNKGGISGDGGTITNCHYLNTCGHNTSTGGTAKTEAQMKSSSFPVILNTDSVVFVMDITPNINQGYPVFGSVRTLEADNIGNTTTTLHGNYQMLYDVDAHGFEYKKTSESDYTTVNTTGEGNISYALSGLQGGTQYTYRFFVQKDGVYYRGADKTFNTIQCTLSAQITSSSNTLCEGDTVIFTASATSSTPTAYQYVWSTGDSLNTIPVMNGANYTITVTDAYGCSATQSKQMTVYPAAVASITGSTVLCNNGGTTLTANGGQYYSWNTGSTQRIITVSQPGTYIATVQTVYGCTASDTIEVTAFANPTINGNLTFCSGDYTTLTASGGDSYLWSNGATTPSINVSEAGTYSVTASTSNGCSGNASVSVSENQASEVQISGNAVICSGVGTTLTASAGATYLWSNGASSQSVTANTPGTYTVTVSNAVGCSSTASIDVTIMSNVTIGGVSSICEGQNTILSVSDGGNYLWSNGATTSFITVSQPGLYSVTVSLPNGCSSSASTNVTIASNPTPSIFGNTTFCQGQSTTLTANGGNSYAWSNGSTNNSISVSQSGVYTVTASNAEGCSATAQVSVTVNPLPSVNITGNSSFCQGDNTTLIATGANTYMWSNNSTIDVITVNAAGTYIVTGTDANGCTNTATKTVSVNPTYNIPLTHSICQGENYNFYGQNLTTAGTYTHTLQTANGCDSVLTLNLTVKALPTPSISGITTLCQGESTTLTANGGVCYAWSNGSTNNSISVSQSGVYTVTATNAEGCSNTANITVTVNPVPNVTISGNTTICAGSSTTLTASGADTFSWSTGENTPSVSISTFGVYSVTGTSAAGCSGTANATVLVSQAPQITISGETNICAGESTTITATGGDTYLWNDGTTDNSLTVSAAGTYQVIGYNTAGCYSMASTTVSVWQPVATEFTVACPDPCYTWNDVDYCETGDYTQTLQTVHGCDSVVTMHLTITVGVEDYAAFDFKVYPNPSNGIVNVQWTMNGEQWTDGEIHIVDMYGRLLNVVGAQDFTSPQMAKIDLSRCADGVYFLKWVADGKTLAVRKVVKQ